ncbi:MAG: efflux RND transporter permease subunit, partial [Oceanococcaceae bacterium]
VDPATLSALDLTLPELAQALRDRSQDAPVGLLAESSASRELRAVQKRRGEYALSTLLLPDRSGEHSLRLGDVASIDRAPKTDEVLVSMAGAPAVELALFRSRTQDALDTAEIVNDWIERTRPILPPELSLHVYDEQWKPLQERITLLLKNGLSGLVLIVAVLYLFLTGRVAFWVTVGIPVSFLATLFVLYLSGGSINMMSLFALIMALGIIVDDAIVVGEDAAAHYDAGEGAIGAAEGGARRMFWPVISSSATTIAAFLPLMLIGDYIGAILFAIPMVVICVIIASLIESFLILPGHLRHSLERMHHRPTSGWRRRFDVGFARFREGAFRRLVRAALGNRRVVLATALAGLVLAIGLLSGGRITFTFFPTPELNALIANVGFAAGTPDDEVQDFLAELERSLGVVNDDLGGDFVLTAVARQGTSVQPGTNFTRSGRQYAHMQIELTPSDARDVRNAEFIRRWEQEIQLPTGLDTFGIFEPSIGPPGRDIELRLVGQDLPAIKRAALELVDLLQATPGVSGVDDDTPFGREQILFALNAEGEALGLDTRGLAQQLRAALDGELVQIYQDDGAEIEVRLQLTSADTDSIIGLNNLPIRTPAGRIVPLGNVVNLDTQRGFDRIRRSEGQRAIKISADVDESTTNATALRARISRDIVPDIEARFPVRVQQTGQAENQANTFADMQRGLLFALALIYIVLAWVFASWGWPLLVMSIIPFGLVGAIFGHWLLGMDLTILSLFGLFGLSGIVVNDSIILVVFYKQLREAGVPVQQALEDASCLRLRAVLLTSLTTIGGLIPLMFETSLQAQFLIPMATSIVFGLALATLLVLVLVPTLLSLYEQYVARAPRTAVDSTLLQDTDNTASVAEQHG